jgi:6-phosphogluconolactonase
VTVDPSGKYAYTANTNSSDISGFAIDPITGALANLAGTPFSLKGDPGAIVTVGKIQ